MGGGAWTSRDWDSYKTSKGISQSSTASTLYTSKTVKSKLSPIGVDYRESCDSAEHPESTPIIICLDVTGSMSMVLETVVKKLGTLVTEIFDRKTIKDPQIMFIAFGDTTCDSHPLQVTQFESDIRIAEQLQDIYFERGGGGNDGESYILPWYFASRHTKIDSFNKRGKKGYLFTIGDEPFLDKISKGDIKKFVGDDIQAGLTAEELLNEVSRQYEVYHVMVGDGGGMRWGRQRIIDKWTNLLGQRAVLSSECDKIPEIIISILEVANGKEVEDVVASWDGDTSLVVKDAIGNLAAIKESTDLIEF